MKPGSILEAVARHEQELVARLEATQRQADQAVADARAQAVRMRDECRQKLERDAGELRRQAEAAREEQREALRTAAAQELERRRAEAQGRAPKVVQEVIALILPRQAEDSR